VRVLTKVFTRTYHCKYVVLVYAKSPAGVSCLKVLVISLNADNNTASTAQCNGIEF